MCFVSSYICDIQLNMAYSKKHEFDAESIRIADIAKALSHPARIEILKVLSNGQCVCGDIVDELPLSQSTVSQHLKELKEAGLIKGDIEGVKVCYCIDEKEWQQAKQYLATFFNTPLQKASCC